MGAREKMERTSLNTQVKHPGMGFSQDGAEQRPIHALSAHGGDHWEKFSSDTDTNISAQPVLESG